jgi:PAT family beta-lactamase induction signal transducer AmpG
MAEQRQGWRESLAVYTDRRVLAIFFLGFSSGLPLALVYSTLSAWLEESGVSLKTIGFFSLASSAYALKFLWSPLVDRLPVPGLTSTLGRRRGWMLLSQVLVAICMVGLGSTDPKTRLVATAAWAVALAFASATQDIVIDAYRVDVLAERELGAGAANIVFGYRVAMLVSGAGALILADRFGWHTAYVVMAALMGVGMLTTLLSPEPTEVFREEAEALAREEQREVERFANLSPAMRRVAAWFHGAVIGPFRDFMRRPGWILVLLFIALYKYGDALLGVMANPFYLQMGFTKTEIGVISKVYGFVMSIIGSYIGGVMVARKGIYPALLTGGILQALAHLVFCAQAVVGHSIPMLTVTISIDNLTTGLATAAFVAYLSALTSVAYTATQYALLSSFMAFARTFFASIGGALADRLGWINYFVFTTVVAVPGLVLLVWMMKRFPIGQRRGAAAPEEEPASA